MSDFSKLKKIFCTLTGHDKADIYVCPVDVCARRRVIDNKLYVLIFCFPAETVKVGSVGGLRGDSMPLHASRMHHSRKLTLFVP